MTDFHDDFEHLCPDDRRVLDALVDGGFDPAALEASSKTDHTRAEAVMSVFSLLHDYPVEDADDVLIDATLARIKHSDEKRHARMRLDSEPVSKAGTGDESRWKFRIRVPDFITVAAILLIVVSVALPIFSHVRNSSIDRACANNMRSLGMAFANYASDYEDRLPVAMAGISWDQLHNMLNLSPLVRNGYCEQDHLNCPGNHDDYSTSYSYQWQESVQRVSMSGLGSMIILGDRNPLIDAAAALRTAPAMSISINHGGRGQNVLQADGSVAWLEKPRVGRDNIWLPQGHNQLQPGDQPQGPADVFLTH